MVGSSVGSDVGGIKVGSDRELWLRERTGLQLLIPRRWQYSAMAADGRSSPDGREPSARMSAMREERERCRRSRGSGGTSGDGSSGVLTGDGVVG
jgi:hypothetical protein